MKGFILGFLTACIICGLVCLVVFGIVTLKTMLICVGVAIVAFFLAFVLVVSLFAPRF